MHVSCTNWIILMLFARVTETIRIWQWWMCVCSRVCVAKCYFQPFMPLDVNVGIIFELNNKRWYLQCTAAATLTRCINNGCILIEDSMNLPHIHTWGDALTLVHYLHEMIDFLLLLLSWLFFLILQLFGNWIQERKNVSTRKKKFNKNATYHIITVDIHGWFWCAST